MTGWSRKLWLSVGAAALVGSPSVASAQHPGHNTQDAPPARSSPHGLAPPQGGESYLTDGGPADTRIRIYRDIVLIRGHLRVGAELIEAGQWEDALPHFLHPTEELYGGMERYIRLHGVTPFDRQLKAQAQAVKARNKPAYLQAAKIVDQRLNEALQVFRRFMTVQPFWSYSLKAAVETLKVAALEYDSAISDGAITKPVEYQDGRGFVLVVEQLIESHGAEIQARNGPVYESMLIILREIKSAWPTAEAPRKAVLSVANLARLVAAFEQRAELIH